MAEKGVKDDDLVRRATIYLKGTAATWYRESGLWKDDDLKWEDFCSRITQRFDNKTPRHVVIMDIAKMKLKAKEDIRDFGGRITSAASRAEPEIDETDLCGMLLKALPPHYRTLNPTTKSGESKFEALVNECRRIQVYDAESTSGSGPSMSDKSGEETNGGDKRFRGTCNYCKRQGHKEAECRKKKADAMKTGDGGRAGADSSQYKTRAGNSSAHWDPKTHQKVNGRPTESVNGIVCWFCNREGHKKQDCPKLKKLNAMLDEMDISDSEEGVGDEKKSPTTNGRHAGCP
jgi:hypothetical protein